MSEKDKIKMLRERNSKLNARVKELSIELIDIKNEKNKSEERVNALIKEIKVIDTSKKKLVEELKSLKSEYKILIDKMLKLKGLIEKKRIPWYKRLINKIMHK